MKVGGRIADCSDTGEIHRGELSRKYELANQRSIGDCVVESLRMMTRAAIDDTRQMCIVMQMQQRNCRHSGYPYVFSHQQQRPSYI